MKVNIPEPFQSALHEGRPAEVCDAAAPSADTLYARALARILVGRLHEARTDLQDARSVLGDICAIEIVHLDLLEGKDPLEILLDAQNVLTRAVSNNGLKARACHVIGLVRARLQHHEEARAAYLEASNLYRGQGDRLGRGRVLDAMGTLHLAQGRIDLALGSYATSLVEKTMCEDRPGTAVTLGNLGNTHLRVGRFLDAVDCFELSYRIFGELRNHRDCAQMLGLMGRVRFCMKDLDGAQEALRRCIDLASEEHARDLEFLAHRDLALCYLASNCLEECARHLERAEEVLAEVRQPFKELLLDAARGELGLLTADQNALPILEKVVRRFRHYELNDHGVLDYEIPLRMTLARAYLDFKFKRSAEICLGHALEKAQSGGYEHHVSDIREAMATLRNSGSLCEEEGRLDLSRLSYPPLGEEDEPADRYSIYESMGQGAFGEVFRAHDPRRDQIVTIKSLYLGKVYHLENRKDLMAAAKLEVEAASRIRHPGVARVYAIGEDLNGNTYIVQEYVHGRGLREFMGAPDPAVIIEKVGVLASALEALHKHGVVHRNIKPENIILRAPDLTPVLVDFGLAFVPHFKDSMRFRAIPGVFDYMAPEQLDGTGVDSKSDFYALGVILFEWLTGALPLESIEKFALLEESSLPDIDWAPLERSCRHMNPNPSALVKRLLDPDPNNRPDAQSITNYCRDVIEDPAFS